MLLPRKDAIVRLLQSCRACQVTAKASKRQHYFSMLAITSPLQITLARQRRKAVRLEQASQQIIGRRGIFGIGEIVGVLSNPAEVVRNLTESKKLLEEARQDLKDMKERSQMPPKHTFSPLPGFYERKQEIKAIERALSGVPTFNVLFGASSVGKTALCRQVLTQPHFHVLHFDLRIAGFADLPSLYFALAGQMEQYFIDLSKKLNGYEEFEKESYTFKFDRMAIEKRCENGGEVKCSDIAHLLELLQSALLKYWSFQPKPKADAEDEKNALSKAPDAPNTTLNDRKVNIEEKKALESSSSSTASEAASPAPQIGNQPLASGQDCNEEKIAQKKLVPVIFFDEAHRLPLLIRDRKAMKCILDAMLVLTKQDRLIHVIHATSDPFYMHWLRQLNVMQHCKIMSIGDASRVEAERYFQERLLGEVPDKLKAGLRFDEMYEIFGGKLAHMSDYVSDYVNADGKLTPKQSSHYAQAHALLNLQLIHASPSFSAADSEDVEGQAAGFGIYSPLGATEAGQKDMPATNDFTPDQLLLVCERLLKHRSEPYFPLCRELGARAVDGLVKGRILELRWVETVTPEDDIEQTTADTGPILLPTTPVVRAAMKQVVKEWRDYQSPSAAIEEASGQQ